MALIPEDPKQRNALVIGLLAAAGFYFFWTYWYTPKKTEVDDMTARLEQLDTENNRAQLIATRGGNLQERLDLYERHVGQLERLIPQSEEVPALLNDITAEVRRAGMRDPASLRPEAEEQAGIYTRQSYEMELIGDYHQIARFLTAVASLPRIITPVDLELGLFQGDRTGMDRSLQAPLIASFRIQTYILPGAQAPPPPQQGGEAQPGG